MRIYAIILKQQEARRSAVLTILINCNHAWCNMEIKINLDEENFNYLENIINNEKGATLISLYTNFECVNIMAFQDNKPIGVALVGRVKEDANIELHKLYVVPNKRKSGVATGLIHFVMEYLNDKGEECLFVEALEDSIPFWEKFIEKNNIKTENINYTSKFHILL